MTRVTSGRAACWSRRRANERSALPSLEERRQVGLLVVDGNDDGQEDWRRRRHGWILDEISRIAAAFEWGNQEVQISLLAVRGNPEFLISILNVSGKVRLPSVGLKDAHQC
jgi:hypothetical protein